MKASTGAGLGLPALISAFSALAWTGVFQWNAMFSLMLLSIVALVLMNTIPQDSADRRRLWEAALKHLAIRKMIQTALPDTAVDGGTTLSKPQ
ncbi:hypothetical protein FHR83_005524 [Actinoplanes campanulatus]|uniref:Uncharacterized protein n=1 Tax=Actinoplanes campanulatus TaxID=113559 RepID=A0A7W5FGV8_9ACTN|nr:hypothetical protein [Actinoplanes campanulatus]MBB3097840.1 hypothetical protein [Actinoplanes campanulatus]